MNEPHVPDEEELKQEVHLAKSTWLQKLLVVLGTLFLGLGLLGVILPILPTTPFLLLTAACYAHGSEKFYLALMENRFLGPYIRDWREGNGIPLRTKVWVILLLVVVLTVSIVFVVDFVPAQILMGSIGVGVSTFIWTRPTKRGA